MKIVADIYNKKNNSHMEPSKEMIKKFRILFFGSGDFPVGTLEHLINTGYDIAGVVTSRDKIFFEKKRVSDVARENDIDCISIKNVREPELEEWLDRHPAEIYCVISFKFLPDNILKRAKLCAFNIHASLLPFLRGAAPINRAILYGFKETGLTAFRLSDEIDCGNILENMKVTIDENENFGSLHQKLSCACPVFTQIVIDNIIGGDYKAEIHQQNGIDLDVMRAPKLTQDDFKYWPYEGANAQNAYDLILKRIRSVSPVHGFDFPISVYDYYSDCYDNEDGYYSERPIKRFVIKVFDAEVRDMSDEEKKRLNEQSLLGLYKDENGNYNFMSEIIETDFKTYMRAVLNCKELKRLYFKRVQMPGKKIMDIAEFVRGLQHFNRKGIEFRLEEPTGWWKDDE